MDSDMAVRLDVDERTDDLRESIFFLFSIDCLSVSDVNDVFQAMEAIKSDDDVIRVREARVGINVLLSLSCG